MSRITIKDIAKLLEVNPSTVSRALKNHPDIGEDMKQKVQKVAKDLGYQPNYQAIHFRQKKSKLIGLIIPDMEMFFFPDIIKSIEEVIKKNGYNLIIFQSNESLEREQECASICQNFGVDGLLVCLTRETQRLDHFEVLTQNDIPIVFLDKVIPASEITVIINDFQASFTAVRHLAKKNYQKISGVFGNANLTITQQRKAGFKAALKKHHLTYYDQFCFHANTIEEVKTGFLTLMKQEDRPDAVFAMTDQILAGVIPIIYEQGFSIPKDIALISISNGHFPYYLNPKITHIKHSGYVVGKTAADLLFDLIANPDKVEKTQIELETYLIELDSC